MPGFAPKHPAHILYFGVHQGFDSTPMPQDEIFALESLSDQLAQSGADLMAECQGSIFPCDALTLTVIARAISLTNGFSVLVKADNYDCAAGLLRFQLDNILRLFGVSTCGDPHEVASRIINGEQLNKIKHSSGDPMTDGFLVRLLGKQNGWVAEAYKTLSGFVHLSDTHFHSLIAQSVRQESGSRDFMVSGRSEHVSDEEKAHLVRMFSSVTRGVSSLVDQWAGTRKQFGTVEQLLARFNEAI